MSARPDDRLDAEISRMLGEPQANSVPLDAQLAPYLEVADELHHVLEHAGPHLSPRAQVQHLNALREHARKQPRHQGIDWNLLRGHRMRWAAAGLIAVLAIVFVIRASDLLRTAGTSAGVPPPTPTPTAQPTFTPTEFGTVPAIVPPIYNTGTPTLSPTLRPISTQTPSATLRATTTPSSTLEVVSPTLATPSSTRQAQEPVEPASEGPAPTEPEEIVGPQTEPPAPATTGPQEEVTSEPDHVETKEPDEEETDEPEHADDSGDGDKDEKVKTPEHEEIH